MQTENDSLNTEYEQSSGLGQPNSSIARHQADQFMSLQRNKTTTMTPTAPGGVPIIEQMENFNDHMKDFNHLSSQFKDAHEISDFKTIQGEHVLRRMHDVKRKDAELGKWADKYAATSNDLDIEMAVYSNTVNPNDPYLGQNVDMGGMIAYVTNEGVAKGYTSLPSLESTYGNNGCPSSNAIALPAGASFQGRYSTGTDPVLFAGDPMITGQSCGNEGQNVVVTNVVNNPTATLLGMYNDSTTNPSMTTYLDGGQPNYSYATCLQAAADSGSQFFSLSGMTSGPNQGTQPLIAVCGLSNTQSQVIANGQATSNCQTEADNYAYGTGGSMTVYQNNPAQYVGVYNDGPVRAMSPVNNVSFSFSYGTCMEYAQQNNYQFFALQGGDATSVTNPNATCFVSNDFSSVEQYGVSSSPGISGNPLPGSSSPITIGGAVDYQNAVYELGASATQVGCYNIPSDIPSQNIITGSTYSQCQQTATASDASFFGLGNFDSSTQTATCYVSPFQNVMTAGGLNTVFTQASDGNNYGNGTVDAVYQVNATGTPTDLGQFGYVNAGAELLPYPTDMITYPDGTENGFSTSNNINITGYDMATIVTDDSDNAGTPVQSQTADTCADLCYQQTGGGCGGYVFDNNTGNCWLKTPNFVQQAAQANNGSVVLSQGFDTYIRNPTFQTDESCSQDLNAIDSVQWTGYPGTSDGAIMQSGTACGLKKFTEDKKRELDKDNNHLQSITSELGDHGSEVKKFMNGKEGFLEREQMEHKGVYTQSIKNHSLISKAAKAHAFISLYESQGPQINNMLSVSDVTVLQQSTQYSLWLAIAFLVLAAAIFVVQFVLKNKGEALNLNMEKSLEEL